MTTRALLLSDEPVTVTAGARRLQAGGFGVEHCPTPAQALALLRERRFALCVVDLDLESGLSPNLAVALTAAAAETNALLVAISASPEATVGWPASAGKPFGADEARRWRAQATQRLPVAEASAVSLERLAENLGGCVEDAIDMLRDYENMAVPHHAALREAIGAGDWDAVADIAHRVCGALGAIEAREAAATCRQLMNAAGSGVSSDASSLAARVVEQLHGVEQGIRRYTHGAGRLPRQAAVG